jgi:hypothetical protein
MAPNRQKDSGPPMTLGNMRELGVQHLIASCLNDACRHQVLFVDARTYNAGSRKIPPINRNELLRVGF